MMRSVVLKDEAEIMKILSGTTTSWARSQYIGDLSSRAFWDSVAEGGFERYCQEQVKLGKTFNQQACTAMGKDGGKFTDIRLMFIKAQYCFATALVAPMQYHSLAACAMALCHKNMGVLYKGEKQWGMALWHFNQSELICMRHQANMDEKDRLVLMGMVAYHTRNVRGVSNEEVPGEVIVMLPLMSPGASL